MLLTEKFLGWVFFGIGSTLIDAHTLSGQTEGLSVGFKEWVDGWAEEWVDGWMAGWVDGWMGGWKDGYKGCV